MDARHLIWVGAIVGGIVGGYVPSLWDAGMLSISGIVFSTIGGLVGIYIGYKISSW